MAVAVGLTVSVSCSADEPSVDRGAVSAAAQDALKTMQDAAAELGKEVIFKRDTRDMPAYKLALKYVAASISDAGGNDRESVNLVTYLALNLANVNATQAASGVPLDEPYTSESRVLDGLIERAEKAGVEDYSPEELTYRADRELNNLVRVTLLGNKALTDQIVPFDSPLRTNWDEDDDGRFAIPQSPLGPNGSRDWQAFTVDLTFERERGSLIGRILVESAIEIRQFEFGSE